MIVRPLFRSLLVLVLVVASVAAIVAIVVLTNPALLSGHGPGLHGSLSTSHTLDRALHVAATVGLIVWRIVRILLGVALVLTATATVSRARARDHRRYVRLWLVPHRGDEAEPPEVRRLLESWHQQLLQRWWRRLWIGQRGMALELVMAPDDEGDRSARLAIVCPEELVGSIEGSLLASYPDSRLVRGDQELPPMKRVVRLKKRQVFVQALQTPDRDEDGKVVDALLSQMASIGATAVLQYTLTPTPALFDRYSRWRYRSIERSSEGAHLVDPTNPGLRSEVLGQELVAGLRIQHRPLFFTDIRVASSTYRACAAIAGAVRGESAAENRLVERYARPWARGRLYLRRLNAGVGNPLPGWRKGVLSSSELARLWQLPSPGLKVVRIARSAVPRIPAPPEISRAPEHTLARDERGVVGIRPEDKSDGLGLIGGQKTGKTSLLCRTVQADAHDDECAVVVLMPKPGDARKALSMVPKHRVVHFLDLERPEFGINPLTSVGDPAMIADKVVDAFRDVHAEGDIRGSSDRYLRQAAQAAIGASRAGVVNGPPTLWHMYRILIPIETAFRERVVESLYPDPRFTDTATFFGRELPSDLQDAPGQTVAKLDAPRNKILRLLVESLDMVLRHPIQVSLDEIVRRREVLIVDGKMGTFGSDNCRVMMQFILTVLYGALQRQQQLPESERVRVALKLDEAHLVINDSFADALATLRSGGLEVVAAWQYGEQVQDPKIRAGLMSLLRQRCMFSMGEATDVREMSQIAMSVYTDMIRADPESRDRLRLTPETIFNLPNHHAVCSWTSRGARAPAFVAQTLPLEEADSVVEHHLAVQRERGCHVPERLPDPLPDLDWAGVRDLHSELAGEVGLAHASNGNGTALSHASNDNGAAPSQAAAEPAKAAPAQPAEAAPVALGFDPAGTSVGDRPVRRVDPPAEGMPTSYTELELDDVRGLIWDDRPPLPAKSRHQPTQRELEILAGLWSYRFLFASQIRRRWWPGSSLRAAQQGLNRMAQAGWVRRFKFQLGTPGAQQRVYCISRAGFELAQQHAGRHGPYIDPELKWRELQQNDPRRIMRDLRVNGWALAFQAQAGKVVTGWRGPRHGRLLPPRRKVRGQWVEVAPSDVVVGSAYRLRGLDVQRFEPVSPDATLELRVALGEETLRLDLLVELDLARSTAAAEERLRRYDALISGWAGMIDRYKTLGTPPLVLFVGEDERVVLNLVRIADRAVTACLAKPGATEVEWPRPGRRAMYFAVERDVHLGSLRAYQLPEHPPDVRIKLEGNQGKPCRPRQLEIIEPRLLGRR